MAKCIECNCQADRKFSWPTSIGQQSADFCQSHAKEWWDKFKNTPSGQGLIISELN